ncbi:acyltransferase family protein [Negadavirga shengliensis]|uniref:Acyltransferase family protein n=1 Tax=Negadavirga shengliensis TaxID=1389218 RepID=A0ABV9T6R6_9BACT
MRRYDLDWLRVIVFGLLIIYHVGMFFVPWDFHLKNNFIYGWVTWPMLFLNQWRLPILFVISGMGTWYALGKRNAWQFSGERIKRLLLPLVFGMIFIIPPQVYVERLAKGQFTGSYFEFWPSLAFIGTYPEGNLSWHHLWFLPYLLLYSLLLTPLFVYLKNKPDNAYLRKLETWISGVRPQLLWVLLPFYFTYTILQEFFPVTHNFTNDWFTMVNYFFFFIAGFSLAGVGQSFWDKVRMNRRKLLMAGMLSFTVYILMNWFIEHTVTMHFIRNAFKVVNIWLWITVCFGYAAQYLNRESKLLRNANEAVYPFYILHQSVMMVIAYWVRDWNWGFWPKASLMILGTFGISYLIYEFLIRRWKTVRPLFGMKNGELKRARVSLSRL